VPERKRGRVVPSTAINGRGTTPPNLGGELPTQFIHTFIEPSLYSLFQI